MPKSYNEKEIQKIMHDLENYTKGLKIGLLSCTGENVDQEDINDYIESCVEVVERLESEHTRLINELKVERIEA